MCVCSKIKLCYVVVERNHFFPSALNEKPNIYYFIVFRRRPGPQISAHLVQGQNVLLPSTVLSTARLLKLTFSSVNLQAVPEGPASVFVGIFHLSHHLWNSSCPQIW
mmetsp:Transcript_12858/g.23836  ORF Transcript_12858/g.23836 Transcript_12858/m.23836 type:complete len:107 (-) Transcript_12858:512-832(-)